jgi:NADPH-dependent 2,4-dienoyl-CoA reductase/sulfur reductase-like enzyme
MKHVILGNGPAGVIAAETIRKYSPKAEILMIGSEDAPPYSRMAIPYLLMGNIQESGTYLRKDQHHFSKLNIKEIYFEIAHTDGAFSGHDTKKLNDCVSHLETHGYKYLNKIENNYIFKKD